MTGERLMLGVGCLVWDVWCWMYGVEWWKTGDGRQM